MPEKIKLGPGQLETLQELSEKHKRDPKLVKHLGDFLLDSLSTNERLLLVLHYHEEMTLTEVAGILKISRDAARKMHDDLLVRIRKEFRFPAKKAIEPDINCLTELLEELDEDDGGVAV